MPDSPDFLVHHPGDSVGVAVHDLVPGDASGAYLTGNEVLHVVARDEVPLGHKVALVDVAAGQELIEYGVRVAVAIKDIQVGDYVHVHNVRSARWQTSVA